jgi:hypothetical protein
MAVLTKRSSPRADERCRRRRHRSACRSKPKPQHNSVPREHLALPPNDSGPNPPTSIAENAILGQHDLFFLPGSQDHLATTLDATCLYQRPANRNPRPAPRALGPRPGPRAKRQVLVKGTGVQFRVTHAKATIQNFENNRERRYGDVQFASRWPLASKNLKKILTNSGPSHNQPVAQATAGIHRDAEWPMVVRRGGENSRTKVQIVVTDSWAAAPARRRSRQSGRRSSREGPSWGHLLI